MRLRKIITNSEGISDVQRRTWFMLKTLIDSFVLIFMCWVAIILTVFEGNVILRFLPESWMVPLFIVLFFANAALLMWTWSRFGPTRVRKKVAPNED